MLWDRAASSHVSAVINEWHLQMWPQSHHETVHPRCGNSDLLTRTFILKRPMSHRREPLSGSISDSQALCREVDIFGGYIRGQQGFSSLDFGVFGVSCLFYLFFISSLALTMLPLFP